MGKGEKEEKERVGSWPYKFRKLFFKPVSKANMYIVNFQGNVQYAVFPKLTN